MRVPIQGVLRPFDVATALNLMISPGLRYEALAESLVTSTSAVHRSVARLQVSGLVKQDSRSISKPAFREFVLHGVRYSFPPSIGPVMEGMPTAWSVPEIGDLFPPEVLDRQDARLLVWPSEGGSVKGEALAPLFSSAAKASSRNERLYKLLAAVDVLRVGSVAARRTVGEWLADEIMWR